MICYKNEVILKKLNYLFKTIPSRKLENCTIFSDSRLLVCGIPIDISIVLCLNCTVQVAY